MNTENATNQQNVKEYLIDASIVASDMGLFKNYLENILILTDISFEEIEARKFDKNPNHVWFARFIIDYFLRNQEKTKVVRINKATSGKHIDQELVEYAANNDCGIITADKGMALWCRFYDVECILLEVVKEKRLEFVENSENKSKLILEKIPVGQSAFVIKTDENTEEEYVKKVLEGRYVPIEFNDKIIVASNKDGKFNIDTYRMSYKTIEYIARDSYEDVNSIENFWHLKLYNKWAKR